MAKKGCIVRIYAGGLFSSGRDLYIVSTADGDLKEVIATPPSDAGAVIAAGYDPHAARDLEVTKSTYKRYLAMAKKNPTYQLSAKQKKALDTYLARGRELGESPPDGKYVMEDLGIFWDDMDEHGMRAVRDAIDVYAAAPIPNKGPLRRRAGTRDWIGKAITRPGKLGGAGFLSKSKVAQEQILRGCVAEYGYRSCLGSVMILERIPDIQNRWGTRLAGLRHFLVRNFGGPGSFGPRGNPGTITVESVKLSPDSRDMDRAILEAMGIKTNPADPTDPRLLEVSDLFMAGLNRQALARLKTIPTRGLGTEDLRFHGSLRKALKNPADFALVPEVSGCPLCAVKSNPTFAKAMANPLYGLTIPQEAVYMHFANLDVEPRQAIRQAKAMSDREAEAFLAHVTSIMGEAPIRTRAGARGTAKKKRAKKAPRKKAKKNASAVMRSALRGT